MPGREEGGWIVEGGQEMDEQPRGELCRDLAQPLSAATDPSGRAAGRGLLAMNWAPGCGAPLA